MAVSYLSESVRPGQLAFVHMLLLRQLVVRVTVCIERAIQVLIGDQGLDEFVI